MLRLSRRRSSLPRLPLIAIVVLLSVLVRPTALITYTLLAFAAGLSGHQTRR